MIAASPLRSDLPDSYQLERTVMEMPVSSGRKIDTKVRLNDAGQILFSTSVGNLNASPEYFFQAGVTPVELLPIPAGWQVMLPASMNASGAVVEKVYRDLYSPNYAEAGFVRFPEENPDIATNLDPTQSSLAFVSNNGTLAGASRFTPEGYSPFVSTVESTIIPLGRPPGYGYFEVHGLSDRNEVLLFAADSGLVPPPQQRLALASPGNATVLLDFGAGDAVPGSFAMNASGDIAAAARNTSIGGADVRFMTAADRSAYKTLHSPGSYDSIYGFALNAKGQVVFAKQTKGQPDDQVVFADVPNNIVQSFTGYRPMINDLGEVVFGRGGAVMFWDSRVPGSQPAAVPVDLPLSSRGNPELLGFNNASRVALSYFSANATTQSLGIFKPVAPTPTPAPTPNPIEERITIVEDMVISARTIKNPRVRQMKIRRPNTELRRLRALNAFEQAN
jgi:hypothetical protein